MSKLAAKKSKKKSRKENRNYLTPVILVAILLLGLFYFKQKNLSRQGDGRVKEEVAQLTSGEDYNGNAIASRSFQNGEFRVNLTVFLNGVSEEEVYGAWLTSESETVFLGELMSAGDVYSVNFESDKDYSHIDGITVAVLEAEDEMGEVILEGTFDE